MANARELGVLRIARPCPVAWASMRGSDSVRTCDHCRLQVDDFAKLTTEEARHVLAENGSSPCAVLYQRRDGSILTNDCPVGERLLRHAVVRWLVAVVVVVTVYLGLGELTERVVKAFWVHELTGKIG